MPRKPRNCPVGLPVHVIQRGNNRQLCFSSERDKAVFAHYLLESAAMYGVSLHGWVFMSNHVHILLTPLNDLAVSKLMHRLSGLYARYFNKRYERSGTLYEGRFRSSLIETRAYFLRCLQYIELNPVRAGMVTDPADYRWSSYHCHAFGRELPMWTPHPEYVRLHRKKTIRQEHYRALISHQLSQELIDDITYCLNHNLNYGPRHAEP